MLVLARGTGEAIMIGHDVKVTVLAVSGEIVRIGIDAPSAVEVHREAIYREIQDANTKAVDSARRSRHPSVTQIVPSSTNGEGLLRRLPDERRTDWGCLRPRPSILVSDWHRPVIS
jgi:carbon storage regulator